MFRVTWNKYWGTRFQDTFITLYFSRRPTKKEIIKAFTSKGHRLYEDFDSPACSGMITVSQIKVEF